MGYYLAAKIAVFESEKGWGRKLDDWMVCLSSSEAHAFKQEFNSNNTSDTVPEWYMQAEGDPEPINLTFNQYMKLKDNKRMWLKDLEKLK